MKEKLYSLLKELNQGLVEREETIKLALLTVLAGENLVLIGPPGTGKSLIARRISECLKTSELAQSDYFEYLLTKFSTPEEIFGPLSISELKQDRFKRNTDGYLPAVHVAFLDEIFKASSSILNSLLTILNERLYHNGSQAERVPLQALIAASNELPSGQEELNALYDRFLVRSFVDYVREDNLSLLFDIATEVDIQGRLSSPELKAIKCAADAVSIPESVRQIIEQIWLEHRKQFKEDRREQLSDRRLRKVLQLLRVSAATNDRMEVDLSDVLLLKDCLWSHPDNSGKVLELVRNLLQRHSLGLRLITEKEALPVTLINTIPKEVKSNIPGYRGSGSVEDPILISSLDDLLDLKRGEVGLKGYHFRQTADIDVSLLSTWPTIRFQGHYDGGCFNVKGRHKNESLFANIRDGSSVYQLKLIDCSLAEIADGSDIRYCESNLQLLKNKANACKIYACRASGIVLKAYGCTVDACASSNILITDIVSNCSITACLIELNSNVFEMDDRLGGITNKLEADSRVNACLVSGIAVGFSPFSGIANLVESSAISNCIIGPLQIYIRAVSAFKAQLPINGVCSIPPKSSILKSNYVLDSVEKIDSENTSDGPSGGQLASVRFNQRFLEHTLQWDFTNVWEWDDATGRPVLRNIGVQKGLTASRNSQQVASKVDLLTQQISHNLWFSKL